MRIRNLFRALSVNGKQGSTTRPWRIVHVDDNLGVLECLRVLLPWRLKNLELFQFQMSLAAWEVLSRVDPDLLITDDCMPGMRGSELVHRLEERGVNYPIIVISTWDKTEEWVDECASRGMRISYLAAPFDVTTFFAHVSRHLGCEGRSLGE